jgi:DNA-binding MarR family transcriptional regulator
MSPSLQQDLRQSKPFATLQHEAYLSVVRTSSTLMDRVEDLLKPHGITATQYNVLRILRGAGQGGLCRNDLRDRMLTRMPDMTRLLDRMEEAGLVKRSREQDDRRMVLTQITPRGREMLGELERPLTQLHREQLSRLTDEQLRTLIDLLTLVREGRSG